MRFSTISTLITFALAILALPLSATAQPSEKIPRIAVVSGAIPVSDMAGPEPTSPFTRAFLQGLRELGYREGENILIEWRSAEGHYERLPDIMAELVRAEVDIIVSGMTAGVKAAKEATRTIPIVGVMKDPIKAGFVQSLAHPGGNITGLSPDVDTGPFEAKRLQLLTEIAPGLQRVGVLTAPATIDPSSSIPPELAAAAPELGVELIAAEVEHVDQIVQALSRFHAERAEALFIRDIGMFYVPHARRQIAEFALDQRLPSIGPDAVFAEAGVLMSYGASTADLWRGLAWYVDRIYRGATPADLPIQQPMRFELVVNKKTAQALGIEIPPIILLQATRAIE
jgi:putative ABC transport system substrate-binding protein